MASHYPPDGFTHKIFFIKLSGLAFTPQVPNIVLLPEYVYNPLQAQGVVFVEGVQAGYKLALL